MEYVVVKVITEIVGEPTTVCENSKGETIHFVGCDYEIGETVKVVAKRKKFFNFKRR